MPPSLHSPPPLHTPATTPSEVNQLRQLRHHSTHAINSAGQGCRQRTHPSNVAKHLIPPPPQSHTPTSSTPPTPHLVSNGSADPGFCPRCGPEHTKGDVLDGEVAVGRDGDEGRGRLLTGTLRRGRLGRLSATASTAPSPPKPTKPTKPTTCIHAIQFNKGCTGKG